MLVSLTIPSNLLIPKKNNLTKWQAEKEEQAETWERRQERGIKWCMYWVQQKLESVFRLTHTELDHSFECFGISQSHHPEQFGATASLMEIHLDGFLFFFEHLNRTHTLQVNNQHQSTLKEICLDGFLLFFEHLTLHINSEHQSTLKEAHPDGFLLFCDAWMCHTLYR